MYVSLEYICQWLTFTEQRRCFNGNVPGIWCRSLCMLVVIGFILHTSQSIPIDGSVAENSEDIHRLCKTDKICLDLENNNHTSENVLCVDYFCKCAPNFNRVMIVNDNQTEHMLPWKCEWFVCSLDEHCQSHDHHRVCQTSTGTCVCRPDFLEDTTNGRKCVPQYGIMPAYKKKPRKFLNKNRITYQEDIEHWQGQQMLWLQYVAFLAFFIGQIALLVIYVVNRRKKMIQKILTREFGRQNSDQLPITVDRQDSSSSSN